MSKTLPAINLPKFEFHLPELKSDYFDEIKKAIRNIEKIVNNATNNNRFQQDSERLLFLLDSKRFKPEMITTSGEIRALLTIALNEKTHELVKLSPALLNQLHTVRNPMGRLALSTLVEYYFRYFTKIIELDRLTSFLRQQIQRFSNYKQDNVFARWSEFSHLIFHPEAHLRIVDWAKNENMDFSPALERMGIQSFKSGTLLRLSQNIYFIKELEQVPVGELHPIFDQLFHHNNLESFYEKGRMLGHKVLEILIDRTDHEGEGLSETWKDFILRIADDPRLEGGQRYQRWWYRLGDERIELVRNWLSRYDLELFLKVLEESAHSQNNEEMIRMFPTRKKMLLGLFRQQKIIGSRLFFARNAVNYLKENYYGKLTAYANVSGESSIIYLKLSNGYHLIEGTHSFKIRYMDKLPSAIAINNFKRNNFDVEDFRGKLKSCYQKEFGNTIDFYEKSHQGNWKIDLIHQLKQTGITLNLLGIFDPDEYDQYRNRYGSY